MPQHQESAVEEYRRRFGRPDPDQETAAEEYRRRFGGAALAPQSKVGPASTEAAADTSLRIGSEVNLGLGLGDVPPSRGPTIDFTASERLGVIAPPLPDIPGAAERAERPPRPEPIVADVTALGPTTPRVEPPSTLTAPSDRIGTALARRQGAEDIAAAETFAAKPPIAQDVDRVLAGLARAPFVGSVPRALGVDPEEQARVDPGARGALLRGAGTLVGVGGEILTTKGLAGAGATRVGPGAVRSGLELVAETKGGTAGRRALRGALEGIPTDIGFGVLDPDLSVAESLALGSGVGAVAEVGLPILTRALRGRRAGRETATEEFRRRFKPEQEATVPIEDLAPARETVDVGDLAPDRQVRPIQDLAPAPAPPPPPTAAPRILPDVPEPPPRIVSLKKAEGAAIRSRLGLDELPAPQRQSFEDAWDEASAQGLADTAVETAEVAAAARRPLRPEEQAAAVQRQLILEDELAASRSTLEDAARAGNDEIVQREMLRTDGILEQIDALTRATDRVGTEAGRALSARRIGANRDTHTLAANLQEARAVKGSQLTRTEIGEIEKLSVRARKIDAKVEVELRKAEEAETVQKRVLADTVVSTEAKRAVRAGGSSERLALERIDLLEQLSKMGQRLNDVTGVSGESLYLIGRLAINTIRARVLQTGEKVALSKIVESVLGDLNNPSITARDVHEALNARSTRAVARARTEVQKQVAELKSQARILTKIDDAEQGVFPPAGTRPPRSQEIRALQSQLTALRRTAYQTGQDSRSIERSVKTINDLQDQLTNFKRTVRRGTLEPSSEFAGLQQRIRALRQEMGVEDRLLILQDQLRTGEFKLPEPRRAPPSSPSLEAKQIALKNARQQVRARIQDLKPRTVRGVVQAGTELARTIKATADFSATLRQGFLLSTRRPVVAAKTLNKSVRAFFSKHTSDQIDNAIRQHPNQQIRERAGLELSDVGSGVTGEREEFFASNLASRIPAFGAVVRASERSMTTTLNLLRTAAFDQFLDLNPNATIDELRAWADYVNVASGRGNLGRLGAIGTELSTVIFAPRFAVSRFQAPTRLFKYWNQPRVRKEIAKEYAATVGVGLTALGLADLAGFEVGINPRDSDFGKIRFGDTRIDIWGGVQQPARLIARIILGGTDKAGLTGRTLTDSEKDVDPLELLGRFAAFKIAPSLSIPLELYRGQTAVGEERTPSQTAVRAMIPLVLEDVLEAATRSGLVAAAVTAPLVTLGVGVSTFPDSEGRVRRDVRALLEEGTDEANEKARQKVLEFNEQNPDNPIRSIRPRRGP